MPGYRNGTESPPRGRRWHSAVMVIVAAGGLVAAAAPAMATAAPANSFKQTNLIANKASFGPSSWIRT